MIETAPPYFNIANFSRGNGFPNIAIEPKSQRLYVSWGDYRNGDIDIFVASSADRGRTWSKPTRVNDDPVHNGKDQFMQWVAVDPADGSAYVDVLRSPRRFDERQADRGAGAVDGWRAVVHELRVDGRLVRSARVVVPRRLQRSRGAERARVRHLAGGGADAGEEWRMAAARGTRSFGSGWPSSRVERVETAVQRFDELAGEGTDLHVTDPHFLGLRPTEEP